MYRSSGELNALHKSKEALTLALDRNKTQSKQLLDNAKTIEQLTRTIKEVSTERDSYKNQTATLKMMIDSLSKELKEHKEEKS